MVGNGVTNWKYDGKPAAIEQGYWFGLVDDALYFKMKTCDFAYYDYDPSQLSQECQDMVTQFDSYMKNIQPYDLLGKCYYFPKANEPTLYATEEGTFRTTTGQQKEELRSKVFTAYEYTNFLYRNKPDYHKLKADLPCGTYDAPLLDYYNKDTVKTALHIDPSVTKYALCSDIDYTMSKEATFSIYQSLTAANKYKILKYSGDSDGVIPAYGTQGWIKELGLKTASGGEWRAYSVGG
jgi:hypothetical protein